MHGIWEVGPVHAGVGNLLLQYFVGVVADNARDIVILSGTTCRVHQNHSFRAYVGRVQGANKELIVGPVNWIATLECHNIGLFRESGTHLGRGSAREYALWKVQTNHLATDIMRSPLPGYHLHGGVLQRGRTIARLYLLDLVRAPAGLDIHYSDILSLIREENAVSRTY